MADACQRSFRLDSEWLCVWARSNPDELIRSSVDQLQRSRCNVSLILQPTAYEDLTAADGVGLSRLQARALMVELRSVADQWERLAAAPVAVFWSANRAVATPLLFSSLCNAHRSLPDLLFLCPLLHRVGIGRVSVLHPVLTRRGWSSACGRW